MRLNKDKKGITLIEIFIVIVIVGIILIPIVLFFNQSIKSSYTSKPYSTLINTTYDAMEEIISYLRQIKDIDLAQTTKISFIIVDSNGVDRKFSIYTDSDGFIILDEVLSKKTIPYYNNPQTPQDERVFFELNFRYFDFENVIIDDPQNNLEKIKGVEVSFKGSIKETSTTEKTISLSTFAKLRNKGD